MIGELSQIQQQQVVDETARYIGLANQLYKTDYPLLPIYFDLKGHTIGMYKFWRNQKVIRYNSQVFAKYFQENLRDTVPHEVAHYIVDMRYRRKNRRPHGQEWQTVMRDFDADASRTANYDLSDIPKRRYSTVAYQCGCQQYQLGIRRHNKVIKRNMQYLCRQCGNVLQAV